MPAIRADLDAAAHVGTHHAEGVVKHVQQAGVIGVLVVLGVELPIVGQNLAVIAQHLQRLDEDSVDVCEQLVAEIAVERRRLVAEGPENHSAIGLDAQPLQVMTAVVEIGTDAALAAHATAERNALQLAVEVIDPVVIDAVEFADVAVRLEAKHRALMRTAIKHRADAAVLLADRDHRRIAHVGGLVISAIRNFRFEAEEIPSRSLEQPLLLERVQIRVGVNLIRHPHRIFVGPNKCRYA